MEARRTAEAWLRRIGLRVAFTHRRRERVRETTTLLSLTGPPRTAADPAHGRPADELLTALRRLPPGQATALVLRHHHGYSNREIAAALRAPESTVASRLAMARDRLSRELGHGAVVAPPRIAEPAG
jgi:RNA polymerase sigma-70 factor (ECF subfamily)